MWKALFPSTKCINQWLTYLRNTHVFLWNLCIPARLYHDVFVYLWKPNSILMSCLHDCSSIMWLYEYIYIFIYVHNSYNHMRIISSIYIWLVHRMSIYIYTLYTYIIYIYTYEGERLQVLQVSWNLRLENWNRPWVEGIMGYFHSEIPRWLSFGSFLLNMNMYVLVLVTTRIFAEE